MKTDQQYIADFDALFVAHLKWTDQQVIDAFKMKNGTLDEEDVVRIFNMWVRKRRAPRKRDQKTD
jgi:hypothetical protein